VSTYKVNVSGVPAAVGENAQFIQNVYRIGADQPPIRAVLREELRTVVDRHTGFGGRGTELTALTDWLRREPGGYHFVTAPSGYGKTALLVHLVRTLGEQGREPVYQFVSRRDEPLSGADFTFRNLCQQLMAFHGFGGSLPTSTVDLRALYPALLGVPPEPGRWLVVVLDGLDEAQGWTAGPPLFPVLPPRVHVVFSAREVADRDWLAEVALTGQADLLRLTTLDENGVRGMLKASGAPAMVRAAEDPAFVRAVHDVSGGDPFYLHYLIPDLTATGEPKPADVRRQPHGLDAYLDRWWRDVAGQLMAPAVADVLGYLAVADGRLDRAALADVDDNDHLNGLTVDAAVTAVERYVIGSAETGYVLSHPRFAEYVRTRRLRPNDLRRYRTALVSWCLSWHEQGWPADTPTYPLQHLVGHLRGDGGLRSDGGLRARLPGVLNAPFLVTRLTRLGSFRGLMDDLRAGIAAVPERIDEVIRLAVTHAAIAAAIADLPTDDLAFLYVRAGRRERALDLAAVATPPWQQRRALDHIVRALLPDAWKEALRVAESLDTPGHRVAALVRIAVALLADGGSGPEVDAVVDRIDDADLDAEPAQWSVPWLVDLAVALRTRDPARSAAVLRRATAAAEAAEGQSRAMAFEFMGRALHGSDRVKAAEAYRKWLSALAGMGLNLWAATEARDAVLALAECDPAAATAAAEAAWAAAGTAGTAEAAGSAGTAEASGEAGAVTGPLVVPFVCAGMAEQAEDAATAGEWSRRALAGTPEIMSLAKSESRTWVDQVRAAAAVGPARHDVAGALRALAEVSYSGHRDEALQRMASLPLGWEQIAAIAAAASDPDAGDVVLATAVRRMGPADPTGTAGHVSWVRNPVTAATLLVELAESATGADPLIATAGDAAVQVLPVRPDLAARLAGVLRAGQPRGATAADRLLDLAVDAASGAVPSPVRHDSPILTVARCCLDQGQRDRALALLGLVARSLVHLYDRHGVPQARKELVRTVAMHDESRAGALVAASREEDRPVLTAALAAGVATTDPDRGSRLVDALPSGTGTLHDPVAGARCEALGSLLIGLATTGAADVEDAAATVRSCLSPRSWLDFKSNMHSRAAIAVARHDPGSAERLLRWAADERLGDRRLVAEAVEALAVADPPRARAVARDAVDAWDADRSSDTQEDLAVLVSALARIAPDEALAQVERGRPHNPGYRASALGWIAASLASVDRERAVELVRRAATDADLAEWQWLRFDALREVALATATWWPAEAERLLSRCLDQARQGRAVTTVAQQVAEAASVRLRLSGAAGAAELIEEALVLLPAEANGATHADALEAILRVVRQLPPEAIPAMLARVLETAVDAGTLVLDALPAILETALAADPAAAGETAARLFAALDSTASTVETVLSA
jgi:hypothetical protein